MKKVKNSKAIKPESYFKSIPAFLGEKEAKLEGLSDEERILGYGAKTTFWKVLKDYIEEIVGNLDEFNEMAISQGMSYEEIGKNTIVISTAKGIIKRIIDKVEDSCEAIEKKK